MMGMDQRQDVLQERGASTGAHASWLDRYLPPKGIERKWWLFLAALLVVMKVLAIYHYRADSDETQHAHVVWSWTQGELQYRDVFDNHMPLFQMLCAPVMAMLGERADIIVALRWVMLPLFFASACCVYMLAETLFSRRIAPWVALGAAGLPKFLYTSTEFRPDQLWAFLWLAGLAVAVRGEFTVKRAALFGLLLGLCGAVSVKSTVLLGGLGVATVIAIGIAMIHGERPAFIPMLGKLLVIGMVAVIPPLLTILYFARRGAFWNMYYCVFAHNVVPGLKRWGHISTYQWYFPVALPLAAICAYLISRQATDPRLAIRRTIILLTPWLYLALLMSYMPDITREDDLPYVPLTLLAGIPPVLWMQSKVRWPWVRARFFTWGLPALMFVELVCVWRTNPLRTDRMKVTIRSIRDVLLLTTPDDYVMDADGNYVFRKRPYYWAFETVTKTRMRMGLIKQSLPEALEKTETKVCYMECAHVLPAVTRFIVSNYLPFDPSAGDMGVAGKSLGAAGADGSYTFDVQIPGSYAVVSEQGKTDGVLDGKPYSGAVRLDAGRHTFRRTAGGGRAAIMLDRAVADGFRPLFDASEKLLEDARNGKKD